MGMIKRLWHDIKTCIWAYANLRWNIARDAAIDKWYDHIFAQSGSRAREKASIEYELQNTIARFWQAIMVATQ
jgi:hypothetical protein